MERANKKLPKWKKLTPGVLVLRDPTQRIKPKEVFRAEAAKLGSFISEFELLEDGVGKYKVPKGLLKVKEAVMEAPANEEFTLEDLGGGWFNVRSPEGTIQSQKSLRKDKAEELAAILNEGGDIGDFDSEEEENEEEDEG